MYEGRYIFKGVEEMLLKAELGNAEWKNKWEIEIGNYFFHIYVNKVE